MQRDIIAYALLKCIDIVDGRVYGGFVRSHYSGLPWTDLDVMKPKGMSSGAFLKKLCNSLVLLLNFQKQQISYKETACMYGCLSIHLKIALEDEPITIKIDITDMDKPENSGPTSPVTIGSCLFLQDGRACFRKVKAEARLVHWSVEDITNLLKEGKDVKLCDRPTTTFSTYYRKYYWTRISKLQKQGWTLVGKNSPEPPEYSPEELQKVVEEMSKKQVELARKSLSQ